MKRAAALAALLFLGCATSSAVPPLERPQLVRELTGELRYLRATSALLPPASQPEPTLSRTVAPDAARLIPAGTPLRIERVELPTALGTVRGERARLVVSGEDLPVAELPLSAEVDDAEQLRAQVDALLARVDLRPRIERFSEAVRGAITKQQVTIDMPAEAVLMAWGPPRTRSLTLDEEHRRELWVWGHDERRVTLVDGVVTELAAP